MPWTATRGRVDEVAVWYINGNRYGLCFDYDVGAVDQIKALPSHRRKWDPRLKYWSIFGEERAYQLAEICAAYLDLAVEHYLAQPPWLLDRATWIENRGWESDRFNRHRREEPVHAGTSGSSGAYAVLHLGPDAPPELVKAAYRTLARIHHPDAGGDPERMKAINNAYEELTK